MNLSATDWAIVAAYFAFSTIVGLVFTKRGGESLNEYFLSGRDVPWWLAGTSMVATTFAADTPLLVTGLVANHGVAGNWLWWNMVMSGMLTVFFFARLWRRSGVMTDVEFAEIRYSGKPAAFLRGFRAVYLGLLMNVIIMGWVTLAMLKILKISLGVDPTVAIAICFGATVLYAAAGGLWAVLWTDLVQFIIKMGAVIVLAVYSVHAVGGIDKLKAGVTAHFGSETAALSVLPIAHGPHGFQAYAWMPMLTIGVFIAVQWWSSWYPGAEPGGGGYVAQRIFAAKTEKDGVLATLLFQVAHYALRPWPWIMTALATVILYPNLVDKESGYVHAFVDLLPTPWKGVMMAGFAAAYMSTIGTQLNWGASYLVNDFYKRFLKRNASDKHYVAASRLTTLGLFAVAVAVTTQLSSIERVQKYLLAIGAGTGLVLILRWYWSRINAWSEISAMIGSLIVSTIAMRTVLPRFAPGDPNGDAWVMIVTVGATTVIWLTVTFLTPREPAHVLDAFNKRVRPHETNWGVAWANWLAGIVAVYASLFGIGKLIFGETAVGLELFALAIVAFAWIGRSFRIYSEDTRRTEDEYNAAA